MTWLAGVDGCRGGWFRVCREDRTGELRFDVIPNADDLTRIAPRPPVIALDIPIGLPDAGARECDHLARIKLGPRRNSVFPAPVRPALAAATRENASQITCRIDGRRVGTQAWALYPKIRQVDEALRSDSALRRTVREVHPEVCFWAWNDSRPMVSPKKTAAGRAERLRLATRFLGPDVLARARGRYLEKALADDDILDAVAALWTAHRIMTGTSRTLPEAPPRDGVGLRMEIVY